MKAKIHPQWYPDATISCACGAVYKLGSTKKEYRVEICGKCHPFFTGEMKYVDTLGRVERFQKKQKAALITAPIVAAQKKKKKGKLAEDKAPKSLREMLMAVN